MTRAASPVLDRPMSGLDVLPGASSPLSPWPRGTAAAVVGSVAAVSPKGVYILVQEPPLDRVDAEDREPPSSGVDAPRASGPGCPRVLPILTSDALALPTAVRMARVSGEVRWGVEAGDRVELRRLGGRWGIDLPGLSVRSVRTWTPSRVTRIATPITVPAGREPDPDRTVDSPLRAAVARAVLAADPTAEVGRLVGLGPGLTPSGDDALAGALLVLWARGLHASLAAAVRAHLHRTTALSASLLAAAMDGYAVPAVVAYVDAAVRGDPVAMASRRHTVEAIGHSSGRDLLAGVEAAVSVLSRPPIRRAS